MPWWLLLLILFGSLLFLLMMGLPVAFSLGIVSVVASVVLWWPNPQQGLYGISLSGFNEMTNFLLVCVPLFILMAEVIFRSGMGNDTYEVVHKFLGGLPGGLGMAAIVFGMIFGAASGASTAGTATVGLLSIPEMRRRNYNAALAGAIVGFAGALSIVIPPSIIFILYGVLSGVSIGALFMGGIIPGILATVLACIYLFVRAKLKPEDAPKAEPSSFKEKFTSLWKVWAMFTVIIALLTAIYTGITTPTEASAVASLLVFIIAALQKRLTWKVVRESVIHTVKITTMIGWIIIGAMAFGFVVTKSGAAAGLTEWLVSLPVPKLVIVFVLMIAYLIMGMFIDPVGIIMMTTPILIPVLNALQIDPLWFGVMVTVNMCAGNISPPMGVNIYIVKGLAPDIDTAALFKEVLPFVIIDFIVILAVMFYPPLATWIPSMMH